MEGEASPGSAKVRDQRQFFRDKHSNILNSGQAFLFYFLQLQLQFFFFLLFYLAEHALSYCLTTGSTAVGQAHPTQSRSTPISWFHSIPAIHVHEGCATTPCGHTCIMYVYMYCTE